MIAQPDPKEPGKDSLKPSARFQVIVLAWIFGFHFTSFAQQLPQPQTRPPTVTQKRQVQPSEAEIQEARELLTKLGYWIIPDAAGMEASLRHALIAFQKIEGRNRTGVLTKDELVALRSATMPKPLETGYTHIEVDLNRQVLFVVDAANESVRVLPVSSGSGEWFTEGGYTRRAITPTGRFKVQRKIEGWRKSPLGALYYPSYIYNGIAIHGNPSVPSQPASHGCIRIPMFAAKEFSQFAVVGMPVIVHDGTTTN